jgi:ribosomal protein S18 acetylase RimI-like enzyme
MSGSLEVIHVKGRWGTSRFVDAAWKIHEQPVSSGWIPPLRMVVRDGLDQSGNPFYQRAERALFIAKRSGRTVGRVAAIENRWHNGYHDDHVGFFGFFECRDDQEAANGLLERAECWLGDRGLKSARGPVCPSMNHECGVLVDGFDFPPVIMTPWNPAYYGPLIERAGYSRARDLLGYYLAAGNELAVPDRVRRLAERTLRKTRLVFRAWNFDMMEEEVREAFDLYCDAWDGNWGFVPPSWEEFWHIAKDLKSVIHPDLAFVAELDGKTVGFIMIARDMNRVLHRIPSGRLWPWNIVRLVIGLPKVLNGRIVLLGLRPEYQNRGFFPLFALEAARRAMKIRAEGAEASWILEDNESMTAPLEGMGLEPYKRWRIYEKTLARSP